MDPIQPDGHQARRTRQNPVSCRLCRLKKLKCNRQQPCSNCSARGVGCEYFGQNPGSMSTDYTDPRQALPATAESTEFQARLTRLEEAVFGKQDDRPSVPTAMIPSTGEALTTTVRPGFDCSEEHEMTSRWLEGIGTLENLIVRLFTTVKTINAYCADPAPNLAASSERMQSTYHSKLALSTSCSRMCQRRGMRQNLGHPAFSCLLKMRP